MDEIVAPARFGQFSLSKYLIEDSIAANTALLDGIVVLEANYDDLTHTYDYFGYSPHFGLVERGEVIPHYNVDVSEDGVVKWVRVS